MNPRPTSPLAGELDSLLRTGAGPVLAPPPAAVLSRPPQLHSAPADEAPTPAASDDKTGAESFCEEQVTDSPDDVPEGPDGPARRATAAELDALLWRRNPKSAEARLALLLFRWKLDPVAFAVECLRTVPTPYQAQILCDVADSPLEVYEIYGLDPSFPKRQVLVPSGHGLGKTRVLAILAWWHPVTHRFSRTLVTAPKAEQLSGRMWGELRKLRRRMRAAWPAIAAEWEVLGMSIVHTNPEYADWGVFGRTARPDTPEGLQGEHALDADDEFGEIAKLFREEVKASPSGGILIEVEEASGVPDEIRQVLDGSLSEAGARFLGVGNATRNDGWFATDIDNQIRYAVHPLDCRVSDRTKTYALPYRDFAGQMHALHTRGFVEPKYWNDLLAECDGNEEHDRFRVRVRGLKPRSNTEQVIQTNWVDQAMARQPDPESLKQRAVVSLDFGLSADKHSLVARRGFALVYGTEWLPPKTPDDCTMQAARAAIDAVDTFKAGTVVGDGNGVGRGAMEYLADYFHNKHPELRVRVVIFNAGKVAVRKSRYFRRRDEMWHHHGRRHLSDPRCSLPADLPGLKKQLCTPGAHEDESKRIWVESKDDIRARTGEPSGNLADAYLQSLTVADESILQPVDEPAKHPKVFEEHFARFRRRMGWDGSREAIR